MSVGAGLYMYDVILKTSRSLSHLLMSSCLLSICRDCLWSEVLYIYRISSS